MRKTELALLTAGILATGSLMLSAKTDTSVTAPEHVLTAHVAQTVAAPNAEVKPVEIPVIAIESRDNAVISDFVTEPEEVFTEEPETVSEPEIVAEPEPEPEPDYVFEAASEPEPEPVEEPSEDSGMTYLGDWTITFYCPNACCCGQWAGGPTASGVMPEEWHTVACGILPFGTRLYVEGLGNFVVEDRGVEGEWLDVFLESHEMCDQYGMQTRAVYITE